MVYDYNTRRQIIMGQLRTRNNFSDLGKVMSILPIKVCGVLHIFISKNTLININNQLK